MIKEPGVLHRLPQSVPYHAHDSTLGTGSGCFGGRRIKVHVVLRGDRALRCSSHVERLSSIELLLKLLSINASTSQQMEPQVPQPQFRPPFGRWRRLNSCYIWIISRKIRIQAGYMCEAACGFCQLTARYTQPRYMDALRSVRVTSRGDLGNNVNLLGLGHVGVRGR